MWVFYESMLFLFLACALSFLAVDIICTQRKWVAVSRVFLVAASLLTYWVAFWSLTPAGYLEALLALLCAAGAFKTTDQYCRREHELSKLSRIASCGAVIGPGALLVHLAHSNLGEGFIRGLQMTTIVVTLLALVIVQVLAVYVTDKDWTLGWCEFPH